MTAPLFLEPAQVAGCTDLDQLASVVKNASQLQRSPLNDILDAGVVSEDAYLAALAEKLGFEFLEEIPDLDQVEKIREVCGPNIALKHQILPISYRAAEGDQEGEIVFATYDPFDLIARQAVARELTVPVKWVMTSRRTVYDSLRGIYGVGADVFEKILDGRDLDFDNLESGDEANVIDEDLDEEASVIKFVNQIIREALDISATDIHVEPLSDHLRIRYRVDGELIDIAVPENIKALQSSVIARLKIMSKLDIAEKRLPQDGRINLQFEGRGIDVRVATVPTVEGESVSLRLLNQERYNLDRLGMVDHVRQKVEKLLNLSNGIILITGPTGSGKSTSLYTFLSELNKAETRIVTIEDPVENKLPGVMQIAVRSEIGLTFASGLRSVLRADPNIVMVGEIRDLETAEIAIRASLTGHLVFSTLHTNDALGGISRLVDMGVEPFLVSASVRAFIAQRLVRKLCERCKAPTEIADEDLRSLGVEKGIGQLVYQSKGCEYCRNTGYSGRLAIYELVALTKPIQDLVSHQAPISEINEQAKKEGYVPMREYGWMKVLEGVTSVEEVISATSSDLGDVV